MSQQPGSSNRNKAEYLARQGLRVPSIRRMVTYEFGACPSNRRLEQLVAEEDARRAKFKRGKLAK